MTKDLSKDTLGVPVIAIGVPTVVDAVTIASTRGLHIKTFWQRNEG
ncbi:GPR endopeptidase [Bacillus subtilis]